MIWPFSSGPNLEDARPLPMAELKKRTKLAVIDDDEDSFPIASLKSDGYTIDYHPRVTPDVLGRLERGDYDIIVLDIKGIADETVASGGDGLDILERVKTINPAQVVVAFSGKKYDLSKSRFWAMADDNFSKPITLVEAKTRLDQLIQEKVSVQSYWAAIRALLGARGASEKNIKQLERQVLNAASRRAQLSADDIADMIGRGKDVLTIAVLVGKLLTLWNTQSS